MFRGEGKVMLTWNYVESNVFVTEWSLLKVNSVVTAFKGIGECLLSTCECIGALIE